MSLMEHRNAASKVLQSLWTPESMASSGEHRTIYNWFMHFDVIASMMAGHNTTLSHVWSEANLSMMREIQRSDPTDTSAKVYCAMCAFQDLAVDASIMSAKRSSNQLTLEEFKSDATKLLARCREWWEDLDEAMLQEAVILPPKRYTDVEEGEEAVCPIQPAPLYTGVRWGVNFMLCDYYGLQIVLKHQLALTNTKDHEVSPEDTQTLADNAISICKVIAAMESYPGTPAGSMLASQAPIGLAALWIPREYRGWMQRQLANCEQMGYVILSLPPRAGSAITNTQ